MKLPWSKKTTSVLLVDDDPDILRMFAEILRHRGYEVVCVPNGEDAIKAVETKPPSLILLDIMMPRVDGMTVLMHLKSNPKTKDIPIIMLSARQQGKDIEKAFGWGACGYLIKPTTAERIFDKIKEVLVDKV